MFTYEVIDNVDVYVLILTGMVYHPGRARDIKVTTKYILSPWFN
jgi:hypothetical protein